MHAHRLLRRLGGVATALLLASLTKEAAAQQAPLALNRFDPAPAGDRFFGVQSPYAAGKATPHVMLLGDYAHNPLVLRWNGSDESAGKVVTSQLFLHLNGGISLFNRLNLNVDLPLALLQEGGSPTNGGTTFASPGGAEFGDLRLGARLRLFGEYDDPFQVAVGGYVWVPTGSDSSGSFVGDGKVRGLPQAIVGGRVANRFIYSAAVGPELRANENFGGTEMGTMLKWGAGVGVLLLENRHLQVGVETNGGVTLRDVTKRNTNAELLADIRYRVVDDLEIGAGAGPGLTNGIGTPDFRGVLMIAYTPEQKRAEAAPPPPPPDRDGDGIIDSEDACPDTKGVASSDPKKNGCPPDRDGDGIIDSVDACPDVAGVADADPKKNGCPPDRDGDGILDAVDACPDTKGVADADPKKNGCPPPVDTDKDGIFDPEDACPNERGPSDPDPKKNGCPKAVVVTANEIIILQQVQFDTGKATIKKESDPLLDEVGGVLKDHPEITKIEVQGHTDDRGAAALNKKLSQQRADAIVVALAKRGIEKDRLTAKGYGPDKPIDTNKTEAGRAKNRRVQFQILSKTEKPKP
ncbi:outer membrane protein OmpA [Labilithrix luteola]|uniref:Outer membrane protein OmpA n=1 Tax=Labilithrix luteola TaxID=1391654 RepID=A0A0K1Q553_9BACT|nr:OmpA family protein [Labilithrix luteola]AKV00540.1 outer membrane protein OmpA [Labilithrix luteola]